jgi:hypothetical protein
VKVTAYPVVERPKNEVTAYPVVGRPKNEGDRLPASRVKVTGKVVSDA